jgi:cyclohexadienyl dehydratase
MSPSRSSPATVIAWLALSLSAMTAGWLMYRPAPISRAAQSPVLESIQSEKVIRVGYIINSPQAFLEPKTGEVSGLYPDLLREVARQLGARIEFEETTFANMLLALDRVHVVVGGGSVTVDRATKIAFTEPVIYLGLGYVCREDDDRFKTEADLNQRGIKVAAAAGSVSEEYLISNVPNAEHIILPKGELGRVALEVLSGRADAGVVNSAQCIEFAKEHPGLRYPTRGQPFYIFLSGLAMKQGDSEGMAFWNSVLQLFRVNGFLATLDKKHNPQGIYWIPIKP